MTTKKHDVSVRRGDTVLTGTSVAAETKTCKPGTRTLIVLTLLAAVFTVALTFATIELPRILAMLFYRAGWIPDVNPGIHPEIVEAFMRIARPIGFACLAVVIGLIIGGFVTKRKKISSLGALIFFLPTFGYFAGSMFFLAGLGILRITWIPFWELNLVNLGDVAYLPYMILVYPFSLVGLDVRLPLALAATGVGLFIFLLGTIAWLYGKAEKRETVTFGIYKYSRHPQYLGYIIWSYGVMLQASLAGISWGGSNPGASLPWLISTLIVVCVALAEEINMSQRDPIAYLKYKNSAPFMFPVPNLVSSLATAPIRLLFGKKQPENRREIVGTFLVYCLIFIALSTPFILLNWPLDHQWWRWPVIPLPPGPSPSPGPVPGTR